MFIDIVSPKKPLEAERIYNKCYRRGEEITPEICMEVLKSTNFATCMKRMLTCVERLTPEKQAGFKEVVLATFTDREQPEEVVAIGAKLAALGGYEEDVEKVLGKIVGDPFLKSEPDRAAFEVFCDEGYLGYDFSGYQRVIFTNRKVELYEARNLPEYLDFSQCDNVDLRGCNLSGVKSLTFKEGSTVDLRTKKILPVDLDVSGCSVVILSSCDISKVKDLKFKEEASVYLAGIENLPEGLDVSSCRYVSLRGCDLGQIKKLKFREGATVNLSEAKNLPEDLDLSMCDEVNLEFCNFSNVKNLKFKNKEQFEKSSCEIPEGWEGKISFADEEVNKGLSIADLKTLQGLGGR